MPVEEDFSAVNPLEIRPKAFKISQALDPFSSFSGTEQQKQYIADEQHLFRYVTSLQELLASSNVKMMKMDVET